jgi:phenylpropionate dioxygenase-like ring-hydroxylating dioxygenase large terminal subunit
MVEYTFRVPHPTCALLYKTTPVDDQRLDVIGIFIHPMREEYIRVHLFDCLLDETNSDGDIRQFQQGVVAEDKPILENQVPKRLPLDPGAETPVRADKTGIAYRRYLMDLGITYGVIRSGGPS